jgi:hypothetical protein
MSARPSGSADRAGRLGQDRFMPTALDKLYELALDFGHLIKEAGTFATVRDHDSARGAMVIATTVRT